MKIKSTKLAAICMHRRDELNSSAIKLMEAGEAALEKAKLECDRLMEDAKKAYHAAKIQSNRMKKEAELIQEALTEELELAVKEQEAAQSAWEVKSQAHLKAELESDETLMELIKKVN